MTTITPYKHHIRTKQNGDYYVDNGVLGESVTINAITSFSLVPITNPNLDKYYNVYIVVTETVITITMPGPMVAGIGNVSLGWYCRIDLISNTGAGSIIINDNNGVTIGRLNSNALGQVRSSVTLTLVEVLPLWCVAYGIPFVGTIDQMPTTTTNGIVLRKSNYGILYSLINGTPNVNTTVDVALPWNNPTNLIIDTDFYSFSGGNSRINAVVSGMFRFSITIGVNISLLSTLTNLRIRPRLNGITFIGSFTVYNASILPYASGVYWLDCITYIPAGSYVEIMVGKTAVSVGTNPMDINTAVYVEYVGQT